MKGSLPGDGSRAHQVLTANEGGVMIVNLPGDGSRINLAMIVNGSDVAIASE